MRKTLWAATAAAALCLAAPGAGRAGLITFDEPFSGGLPVPVSTSGFSSGAGFPFGFSSYGPTVLTDEYASATGVHFSGATPGSGGAILSDPASFSPFGAPDQYGFGVLPHSGNNVLAFTGDPRAVVGFTGPWGFVPTGTPTGPETISFDDLQSSVSVWASGGSRSREFQLQAFDAGNDLLATDTLWTPAGDWAQLGVAASGIDHVVVSELNRASDSWLLDDLSFTADASAQIDGGPTLDSKQSPEPTSLVLLGLGGVGFAGWRWRRKAA